MMMNRQLILSTLSQMSDRDLLDGFKAMVNSGSVKSANDDIDFDAFAAEPTDSDNKPKTWSQIAFEKGPDNRPALSDRKYILPKAERMRPNDLSMQDSGIPHDDGAGAYDAFG